MASPLAFVAEARIQEALEGGQSQDLPGKGHPLDLDGYFAAPSSLRAGFGLLKSAGIVPPEVEAMRSLSALRQRLAFAESEEAAQHLRQELQTRETELAMALERMKRSLKADAGS